MNIRDVYKKEETVEVEELPLGFQEESKLKSFLRNSKGGLSKLNKEISASGIYNNFWYWNIFFLNLSIAVLFLYFIKHYYNSLPSQIGINLDNFRNVDTLVDKKYLYYLLIPHIAIPVITFIFTFRAERRLNHLLIISFLNYAVLGVLEFIALNNLLVYFS